MDIYHQQDGQISMEMLIKYETNAIPELNIYLSWNLLRVEFIH